MSYTSSVVKLAALQNQPIYNFAQVRVRVFLPPWAPNKPMVSELIQQHDVVSKLSRQYGLEVIILDALLGTKGQENGWFDLELYGRANSLHTALVDLMASGIDVWFDNEDMTSF